MDDIALLLAIDSLRLEIRAAAEALAIAQWEDPKGPMGGYNTVAETRRAADTHMTAALQRSRP